MCSYYMAFTKPFESGKQNAIENYNEMMNYTIGLGCMCLIGKGIAHGEIETISDFVLVCVVFKVGCNGLFIIYSTYLAAKQSIR